MNNDLTASGREGLLVGASAFRASLRALHEQRPGAATSVRRLAASLEKLAGTYGVPQVRIAARRLAAVPDEELEEATAELRLALDELTRAWRGNPAPPAS